MEAAVTEECITNPQCLKFFSEATGYNKDKENKLKKTQLFRPFCDPSQYAASDTSGYRVRDTQELGCTRQPH